MKHELLSVPLSVILKDVNTLARIYNLALNCKGVKPERLIFKIMKEGRDTNYRDYIKIKYYRYDNGWRGRYSVDIGYSDCAGLDVTLTDNNIHKPFNMERIAKIIKHKRWVNVAMINKIRWDTERKIFSLQKILESINTLHL
jgi:hypothetical protein